MIALIGRDLKVWGRCSPIQLRDKSRYNLFLHTLVRVGEPVSVSGCYTSIFSGTCELEGPKRRSRSTTGFAGREFKSGWADDVLPLPPAWASEARLS